MKNLAKKQSEFIVYNDNHRLEPYKDTLVNFAKKDVLGGGNLIKGDCVVIHGSPVIGEEHIDLIIRQLSSLYERIVFDFSTEVVEDNI
jgi:hypothetical protein